MIAEIVSLPAYDAQVQRLLTEDERMAMEFFVACTPEAHPLIAGTGGFRKARWVRQGTGKSGGVRAIYYHVAKPGRIYMAAIYAKAKKTNLSKAERNLLAAIAAGIKTLERREG